MTLPIEHHVGGDTVSELVNRNAVTFGGPERVFIVCDLKKTDYLLRTAVYAEIALDIYLLNTSLKHCRIFSAAGAYLLTTTFPGRTRKWDIESGDWRPIKLKVEPFNFPPPLKLLSERCTEDGGMWSDKSLELWKIADLPDHPRGNPS